MGQAQFIGERVEMIAVGAPSAAMNRFSLTRRPRRVFSSSSSSFPSPSSSPPRSPFHPSSTGGVPFSWEEKPGILKLQTPSINQFRSSPLHQPPYLRPSISNPGSRLIPLHQKQNLMAKARRGRESRAAVHDPFSMALQAIRAGDGWSGEQRESDVACSSSMEAAHSWGRGVFVSCFGFQ